MAALGGLAHHLIRQVGRRSRGRRRWKQTWSSYRYGNRIPGPETDAQGQAIDVQQVCQIISTEDRQSLDKWCRDNCISIENERDLHLDLMPYTDDLKMDHRLKVKVNTTHSLRKQS